MSRPSPPRQGLLATVEEAFRSLDSRYRGADADFDATYHVRLTDLGRGWEIRAQSERVRVGAGFSRRADVTIQTDAATWLALREGDLSGIEAFQERRLTARGDIDLAVGFEGLFRLPGGRDPLLRMHHVRPAGGGPRISTLTMGEGPPSGARSSDRRGAGTPVGGPDVLLIHGLGATKASFFDTAAVLARDGFRVHAIDLPGFGGSDKPARGYNARWFADHVRGWMDAMDIDRIDVVGNSMGGRVALELGLTEPDRVRSLVLLAPAVSFIRRDLSPIVRLLRPEFGILPHAIPDRAIRSQFWSMFHDRDAVDPAIADVVADEFARIFQSPSARHAFYASARNIYLEAPFGRDGFYPRLATLRPPALFVWGTHDPLISARFAPHVARWLPTAEQLVLKGCGHVPQVERPAQTNGVIKRFLARAEPLRRAA